MRTRVFTTIFSVFLVGMAALAADGASADGNWPNWRGPNANSVAEAGDPPVTWSESENIKWKIELPGKGHCTPIVWGDKMFLQTAVPTADEPDADRPAAGGRRGMSTGPPTVPYRFNVICLNRLTGEVLWERSLREAVPHEGHHPTTTFASYSPVTDGEHIWASFGSRGLYCLDFDGNVKWSKDLPTMKTRMAFGEGSSPALAGDAVIVVSDHEGDSKIFAFNKDTGELIWEKDRDEGTSWATPLPVQVGDRLEVITCASNLIRSYDAKTGDLIWQSGGLTSNCIPTPVTAFGNVYVTSGFRGYAMKAIKLGHTGDLTDSDAIVWQIDKNTPYVASPLLYEDRIYVFRSLGAILSCYDAKTGKPFFEGQKLEGMKTIYASPLGAAGRIYIADRAGNVMVIKKSDTFEVLATNSLDDGFDASPIAIGDELYLRGNSHLYCIAKQ